MHVYLFEAKSIQAYIFQSGKLKDLIAASERLDRLVDDTPYSTLNRVLEAAKLNSNLLMECEVQDEVIGFTRCKGGAFYAFCYQKEPLQKLRSLWTLTVQQLFPGMEFTDALTHGESLAKAMAQAHALMAQARNTPSIKFPLASAICQSANRTGFAAVPLSKTALKEINPGEDELLDLDTEHHRQAYYFFKLRKKTLLEKFTVDTTGQDNSLSSLSFPLDTNDFPAFEASDGSREVVRDLALIHVDGNGLGLLLRALQEALSDKSTQEYSKAFRLFSSALSQATQQAAFQATKWLYENSEEAKTKGMLPMRPLVLGGDDITLLCQANLAIGYVEQFCQAFKTISKKALSGLYSKYLKQTNIKPYLTASAGVLYHKASHPFTTCHKLVEGLCQEAKVATKQVDPYGGPAAVAFYRISTVLAEDIEQLRQQTQVFDIGGNAFISSLGGYLLESDKEVSNSLRNLRLLASKACEKNESGNTVPISITKFRQIVTHLAIGDVDEARRIYDRALELQNKQSAAHARTWIMNPWLGDGTKSWLSDLLIYAHFNSDLASKETCHE